MRRTVVADTSTRPAFSVPAAPAGLGVVIGIAFLVPVASRAGVTAGHLILVALLPVTLASAWKFRPTRYLLGVELLWCLEAALTDHLHGVALHDSYLTLVRPALIFLTYCGFLWLYRYGLRHVVAASAGFAVGIIIASGIYQVGNFALDPWKYALGDPVSLTLVACAAWAMHRRRPGVALVLGLIALFANLALGFRSELGVVLVAGVIAAMAGRVRATNSKWLLKLGFSVFLAVLIGYPTYGALASSGHLGAEQQYKWQGQSQVTGGAIVGARPEFVAASVIIGKSPLVGQGTGFSVDVTTQAQFLQRLDRLGVSISDDDSQFFFGRGVYLHSSLFQTWAESGILSLPAMLFPWALIVAAMCRALRRGSRPLACVFGVLTTQFFWDFLFSPWLRLGPSILGVAAAGAVAYLCAPDGSRPSRWSTSRASWCSPREVGIVVPTLAEARTTRSAARGVCAPSTLSCGVEVTVVLSTLANRVDELQSLFPEHARRCPDGRGIAAAIETGWATLPREVAAPGLARGRRPVDPRRARGGRAGAAGDPRVRRMVFGRCRYIDLSGAEVCETRPGRVAVPLLQMGANLIGQPGALYRRSAVVAVGGLDQDLALAFDVDLHLRLSRHARIAYLPRVLGEARVHPGSLTTASAPARRPKPRGHVPWAERRRARESPGFHCRPYAWPAA